MMIYDAKRRSTMFDYTRLEMRWGYIHGMRVWEMQYGMSNNYDGMNGERKYQKKWWHYKIKAKKYYNRDKGASVLICGFFLGK